MHSWIILLIFSLISLSIGIFYIFTEDNFSKGKAYVFFLTSYGIISTSFLILFCSLWHFHFIWGDIIHFHPSHFYRENLVTLGHLSFDLLTFLVLGATAIFYLIAIVYSQFRLKNLYKTLRLSNIDYLTQQLKGDHEFLKNTTVFVTPDTGVQAFSFSRISKVFPFEVENVITLSKAMIDILDDDQLETVLAHELGHCTNNDTRYAHLIVTLKGLLSFDPILKHLSNKMTRQQEFSADDVAVKITGKPKSLAKALFELIAYQVKMSELSTTLISESKELLFVRIDRLLRMADNEVTTESPQSSKISQSNL